jgi:hypothetical protein
MRATASRSCVRGEQLRLEFCDTGEQVTVPVRPGLAEWDKSSLRVHRAVNAWDCPYEEVVLFFREKPSTEPQPVCQ